MALWRPSYSFQEKIGGEERPYHENNAGECVSGNYTFMFFHSNPENDNSEKLIQELEVSDDDIANRCTVKYLFLDRQDDLLHATTSSAAPFEDKVDQHH